MHGVVGEHVYMYQSYAIHIHVHAEYVAKILKHYYTIKLHPMLLLKVAYIILISHPLNNSKYNIIIIMLPVLSTYVSLSS